MFQLIKLESLLYLCDADKELCILDRHGELLVKGNVLELLMLNGGKAQDYFNREVRFITKEKYKGVYYESYYDLVVIEDWEL